MMRIITGKARGTKLATLPGDNTRPTSERAKEAIFSMLHFAIPNASVLDLFAGSGQLGLEALSRGASHAVFCDLSRDAIRVIETNLAKTKLQDSAKLICADYQHSISRLSGRQRFDLVFLDPPYALGAVPKALSMLLKDDLLTMDARVICETAKPDDVFAGEETLANAFTLLKGVRYGVAYVTILQRRAREESI